MEYSNYPPDRKTHFDVSEGALGLIVTFAVDFVGSLEFRFLDIEYSADTPEGYRVYLSRLICWPTGDRQILRVPR